jgi:hypothetical protein
MAEMVGWVMVGAWRIEHSYSVDEWREDGVSALDHRQNGTTRGAAILSGEDGSAEDGVAGRRRRRSFATNGMEEEHSIEDLERRRGGSPLPVRTRRFPDEQRRPRALHRDRPSRDRSPPRDDHDDDVSSEEDQDLLDEAVEKGKELIEGAEEVMLSENGDGWWMYISMVGVVVVALALGIIGGWRGERI